MSTPDENQDPYYPPGPALLYVHADLGLPFGDPAARTVTRVDHGAPVWGGPVSEKDVHRERRILRALLEHTLWLLDQEEGS